MVFVIFRNEKVKFNSDSAVLTAVLPDTVNIVCVINKCMLTEYGFMLEFCIYIKNK